MYETSGKHPDRNVLPIIIINNSSATKGSVLNWVIMYNKSGVENKAGATGGRGILNSTRISMIHWIFGFSVSWIKPIPFFSKKMLLKIYLATIPLVKKRPLVDCFESNVGIFVLLKVFLGGNIIPVMSKNLF